MVDESITLTLSIATVIISAGLGFYHLIKKKKQVQVDTVWIIGASSGIGKATAECYAQQGKRVILSSRNEQKLKQVQLELMKQTNREETDFPIVCLDIEKDEQFEEIAKKCWDIFGSIDVLIISCGLGIRAFNNEITPEIERRMMETNYFGPILLAKAILPYMRKCHQGTIVFISSIQGLLSIPGRSSYSAAKHALQGYCESLRAEEAMNGIHILSVSPAYVKTNHSVNAICGDGSSYNKMDTTTNKGMEPSDLALKISQAVLNGDEDLVISPFYMKATILLQHLFPTLISSIMKKKAIKAKSLEKSSSLFVCCSILRMCGQIPRIPALPLP